MEYSSLEATKLFIEEKFPNCDMVFLAGSASRGEETETSDLDIVVFDNNSKEYRESFFMFGWRIECFIYNQESYIKQLASDKKIGRPILANMIVEGKVIKDNGNAEKLKQEASEYVIQGPTPLTEDYINASRYYIYDLLDDFMDCNNDEEALITINLLSIQLADFILRLNGQWTGRGKALTRALYKFDKDIGEKFFNGLNKFYKERDKQPIFDFVEEIYKPIGGQLFAGFSQGKKE